MTLPLPLDEIKFDSDVKLEKIMNILDDNDIGYSVEFDIKYQDNIKEKTKSFLFCPENEIRPKDDFTPYTNESKPKTSTQTEKIICDWTDNKKYWIQ